ncbi:MAG: transposase [Selenomonadaceae bacterium]|nr:transposase [Selenomonadaceae bacterium]
MLYLVKTGCQWRNLPHDFPPVFLGLITLADFLKITNCLLLLLRPSLKFPIFTLYSSVWEHWFLMYSTSRSFLFAEQTHQSRA